MSGNRPLSTSWAVNFDLPTPYFLRLLRMLHKPYWVEAQLFIFALLTCVREVSLDEKEALLLCGVPTSQNQPMWSRSKNNVEMEEEYPPQNKSGSRCFENSGVHLLDPMDRQCGSMLQLVWRSIGHTTWETLANCIEVPIPPPKKVDIMSRWTRGVHREWVNKSNLAFSVHCEAVSDSPIQASRSPIAVDEK